MTALTLLDGVRWEGEPVPGERGHALLAALVLAAPRTVGVADLIDRVWQDDVPDHPEKALQVLVSRTRSRTSSEVLTHTGAGYRLGLREDQVDALRLRQLVAAALAARAGGDLDVARLAAQDARAVPVTIPAQLGPLGDLLRAADRDRRVAGRLLGAVLLDRGDAADALPLLEDAAADEPADEERLVDLLRAEASVRGVPAALARYATYVEHTRDTLGAEPGDALRRLHVELLARDAPVREGLKYDAAPMVGRDDDVARIRGLLERSRVVSVVGPGGLGKTRMAQLVGRLAHQPVVHFVELAGVNAPDGVLPEVASALGVRESLASTRTAQLRADLRSRVAEHLAGPPTLLILDNCEHLVEAVADLVAFLVATTDATRVLTTSRSPLGIAAEQVYLLPQLGEADATTLFAQRARAARSDVRLDPEQVAALVSRLDGLPLAIELAATKVRVMSVAEISGRLADRFALLSGGDRSAPERHQTLEAVIDWSWNLLREDDQAALRTLAVFPDGFSLGGAEVVLGRDPLPAVAELVDQSLLVVREGERMHYRFLETVREYGVKQLARAGETELAHRRLTSWAVDLARDLGARLNTAEQVETMRAIRAESGNLAGVMRTALTEGDAPVLVPLVSTLTGFWMIEGDHLTVLGLAAPVLDLLTKPFEVAPGGEDELREVLALMVVNSAVFTGQPPPAAIELLRELGVSGRATRADAMARLLLAVYGQPGDELAVLDSLSDDPDRGLALLALQWAAQGRENAGDLAGAMQAGLRALDLCDPADGPWTLALTQSQLSGHAAQAGDWELCATYAKQALPVMQELGALEDTAQLRSVIALADLSRGRLDEAAAALDEIGTLDEGGDQRIGWQIAGLTGQAELALARGDVERGLELYRDAIEVTRTRTIPGLDFPIELAPWVLFTEASALFAHVLHDAREQGAGLARELLDNLPVLLDPDAPNHDYPVLGGVLVAVGGWLLTGPGARSEDAVAVIAVGVGFGYNRTLPTMSWANVSAVCEAAGPGLLEGATTPYQGRRPVELREEALRVLRRAVG